MDRNAKGFEIFNRQCTFYEISNRKKCCPGFPSRFNRARLIFPFFFSPFTRTFPNSSSPARENLCTVSLFQTEDASRPGPVFTRVCTRTGRGEKVQAISRATHGQPLSLSLSARWLQRVEEGKRPLLHHPSSTSVERTYPIQTAAQPCASRAR